MNLLLILVLEDQLNIQGASFTYDATGGSEKITGLNSNFATDLKSWVIECSLMLTKFVDVDKVNPVNLSDVLQY